MSLFALTLTLSIINTVLWVGIALLAATAPRIPKPNQHD
jgi:hypothetical protein